MTTSHEGQHSTGERDEIDWNAPVQPVAMPTEAVLAAGVGPTVHWRRSTVEPHLAADGDARE